MAIFNSNRRYAAPVVVVREVVDDEVREEVVGDSGNGTGTSGDNPDGSSPSLPSTALGVVIFVAALVWAVRWFGTTAGPTFTAAEGLGAFALFYVVAQAAERLIEVLVMPALDKVRGFDKPKSKKERDAAVVKALKTNTDTDADKAAEKQAEVDQKTANRSVVSFALTAAAGMMACGYLEADFLKAAGVTFGEQSTNSEWFRMAVTGLVVGGGSAKLHELITNMSKKAESQETPAATGGAA